MNNELRTDELIGIQPPFESGRGKKKNKSFLRNDVGNAELFAELMVT